jgi:hypothetical protein
MALALISLALLAAPLAAPALQARVYRVVGSGWAREPWSAVQRGAWQALRRREGEAT